jgi:CheY-like chemotaxis protein
VRRLTAAALRRQGYNVLEAAGGAEAQEHARVHAGPIHLILTDVVMPHMNGREICERIHALRPGLQVVYMSGYTETGIVQKGVLDEGIAFLQKPFSPAEVAKAIRAALDRNRAVADTGGRGPDRGIEFAQRDPSG